MAIKLNLVKSRLITSHADLVQFKKEATSALLNFADSNVCDLDAISHLLTAKYAEISKALNDGFSVESEVEIYPQPALPEAKLQKEACMQPPLEVTAATLQPAEPQEARQWRINVYSASPEEASSLHSLPDDYTIPPGINISKGYMSGGAGTSSVLKVTAPAYIERDELMGIVSNYLAGQGINVDAALHQPLFENPVTQDPADLVETQQERELAESHMTPLETTPMTPQDQFSHLQPGGDQITAEDLAAMFAAAPEQQPIAADIMAAAPQLGRTTTWNLLSRLATNKFSPAQLLQLKAALKVMAADEEGGESEEDVAAEHAGEAERKAPSVLTAEEQGDIGQVFGDQGELKAASDLASEFNRLLAEVDPDMELVPPVSVGEIAHQVHVAEGRQRELPPTPLAPPAQDYTPSGYERSPEELAKVREESAAKAEEHATDELALPTWNKLPREEQAPALEGFDDETTAIDQWYAESGLNVIDEMTGAVDAWLEEHNVPQFTGAQIVERFMADSQGEGHISYGDIPKIIKEVEGEAGARAEAPDLPSAVKREEEKGKPKKIKDDESDLAAPAEWSERAPYPPTGGEFTKYMPQGPAESSVEGDIQSDMVYIPLPYEMVGPHAGSGFPYSIMNSYTGDVEFQASTLEKAQQKMDQLKDATVEVPANIAKDPEEIEKYLRRQVGDVTSPSEAEATKMRLPVEKANLSLWLGK